MAGQEVELHPPGICIGRETDNDIQILEGGISRYHARIDFVNNHWQIKDLDSSNGTKVNNNRISSPVDLQPGDSIQTGDQLLRFGEKQESFQPVAVIQAGDPGAPPISGSESGKITTDQRAIPSIQPPSPGSEQLKIKRDDPSAATLINQNEKGLGSKKKMQQMLNQAVAEKKRRLRLIILIITLIINLLVFGSFVAYWIISKRT